MSSSTVDGFKSRRGRYEFSNYLAWLHDDFFGEYFPVPLGYLFSAENFQKVRHGYDLDAVVMLDRQQVAAIVGDEKVGTPFEGGSEHMVVFGINSFKIDSDVTS